MSLYFFFFREFHILYQQQEMLGFISMEHILNLAQYRRQGHFFEMFHSERTQFIKTISRKGQSELYPAFLFFPLLLFLSSRFLFLHFASYLYRGLFACSERNQFVGIISDLFIGTSPCNTNALSSSFSSSFLSSFLFFLFHASAKMYILSKTCIVPK